MDGNSDPDRAKKRGRDFGVVFFVCLFPFLNCKARGEKRGVLSEYHQTPINKKNHNKLSQQQIGLQLKGRSVLRLPSFYNPLFSNKFQEISGGWQAFSPYVPKNTPHVHTQAYASSADTRDTHSLHTASENGKLAYCIFLPQKKFWCLCRPVFSKYFGCSVAFHRNLDIESSGWGK